MAAEVTEERKMVAQGLLVAHKSLADIAYAGAARTRGFGGVGSPSKHLLRFKLGCFWEVKYLRRCLDAKVWLVGP